MTVLVMASTLSEERTMDTIKQILVFNSFMLGEFLAQVREKRRVNPVENVGRVECCSN